MRATKREKESIRASRRPTRACLLQPTSRHDCGDPPHARSSRSITDAMNASWPASQELPAAPRAGRSRRPIDGACGPVSGRLEDEQIFRTALAGSRPARWGSFKLCGMRQADPDRAYADGTAVELVLGELMEAAQAGNSVPLSKDGEVVAVVVSPEVAEAGRQALGR
jgi:hypothetical protein